MVADVLVRPSGWQPQRVCENLRQLDGHHGVGRVVAWSQLDIYRLGLLAWWAFGAGAVLAQQVSNTYIAQVGSGVVYPGAGDGWLGVFPRCQRHFCIDPTFCHVCSVGRVVFEFQPVYSLASGARATVGHAARGLAGFCVALGQTIVYWAYPIVDLAGFCLGGRYALFTGVYAVPLFSILRLHDG